MNPTEIFDNLYLRAIVSLDGKILDANDLFCTTLKYSQPEVVGSVFSKFNSGYHDSFFWKELWSTIVQGEIWSGTIRNKAKDEHYVWLETKIFPIFDDSGKLISYAYMAFDVTEKEMAFSNLSTERTLLDLILDSIPEAIVFTDQSGLVLGSNNIFEQLVGVERGAVNGIPSKKYFTSSVYKTFFEMETFHDDILTPEIKEVEYFDSDGNLYYLNVVKAKYFNDEGETMGVITICHDQTRQKLFEQDLITATQAAEKATVAKSDFLSVMSHELRTPLTTILGISEILHDSVLDSEQADMVKRIKTSGDMLYELINTVLDFSKIEAGKFELEELTFSLSSLIEQLSVIFEDKAKDRGIDFVVNKNLSGEDLILKADKTRINQVLINLLGNAIKFTEQGSVTLDVITKEQLSGEYQIVFEVTDTGIGMTEEQIECVFNPFEQADNSISRRFGGTGLGTTITKKIVDLMGGKINVKSTYGFGSTFSVELMCPVGNRQDALDLADANEIPSLSGHILLCEDTKDIQYVVKKMIEKTGVVVDIANNGEEGVIEGVSNSYDLILMDMQMPIMNGIEATQQLRDLMVDTTIYALTANTNKEAAKRFEMAGVDGFLAKPIKQQELYATLSKHLSEGDGSVLDNVEDDEEEMAMYKELFYSSFEENLINLINAYNNKDAQLCSDIGHTLKGSGGTFGHPSVTEWGANIEKSAISDFPSIADDIKELQNYFSQLENAK